MNKITTRLDSIAGSLEYKGFVKEATEIDAISNTLEAAQETPTQQLKQHFTEEKTASLIEFLDYIADGLESGGFLKEASEIDILSNTMEQPNNDPDPQSIIEAIKSMGTKEQVGQYLKRIMERAPGKFQKLVDTIWELTKNVPISGLGRSA